MPKVVPEYKEKAKKRIMMHAAKLFSEKGYYKTKMIDIAESMGVSKGAIYQYFGSKQDLLLSVLETHTSTRGEEVEKFLTSGGIAEIATEKFFDRMLSMRLGSLILNLDLLREAAVNSLVLKWVKESFESWVQGLSETIERFKKDGTIKSHIDSESIARGILAIRDGLYSSVSLGSDISKIRRTWVTVLRLLMMEILVDPNQQK
ncbi:MAG: TetR/AcrR family transcriptional regulator [Candidatus Thorarchaeota archaeon]|nr:TetR/AcrR family transcriptional regulator [Candidatus Thorarchaeota archaeon]